MNPIEEEEMRIPMLDNAHRHPYGVGMKTTANTTKWTRLVKASYRTARAAIVEARECQAAGFTIGVRAALETVAHERKRIAERRRAIAAGRPV